MSTIQEASPRMQTSQGNFKRGAAAGLIAGIIASAIMLLLSFTLGTISLPEALGSAIAQALPLPLFTFLHEKLGADAKHYLFYIVLVGQCLIFALFGGLFNIVIDRIPNRAQKVEQSLERRWRNEQGELPYSVGMAFALVLWLFSGLIFLPLTGAGLFGSALVIGTGSTMLSLAIVGIAYGILFIFVQNWLAWRNWQHMTSPNEDTATLNTERTMERRTFIRNGAFIVGIGALGFAAWRFISNGLGGGAPSVPATEAQATLEQLYKPKITPPPTPHYGTLQKLAQQTPEVTSNSNFYIVSKNLVSDPTVNGSTWNLSIKGLVKSPYTLTYNELMALPRQQQYESMMCISNEVGGNYMSNALWEGISLKDLLDKAGGITAGATKVVLRAVDDYSDSIHIEKALEPTTLVAVRMNGVTLPTGHGYPARLLVPGIYGMKHVKWITSIEVVNTDYQGYWQQNGWDDAAPIRMASRIDTPLDGSQITAEQQTYIAGVAFAGNKGISEVDISFDNGQSWQRVTLQRPLSKLTWVLWQLPWQPQAGKHTLIVRAIDMEGNVQDPRQAPPQPIGSSGYHTVNVTAS